MEYSATMMKSLEAANKFLEVTSNDELLALMSEFDDIKVSHYDWFYDFQNLMDYVNKIYSEHSLFEEYKNKERKSIILNDNIIKDLIKGPLIILN